MPAKSAAQYKFMQAKTHGDSAIGPSSAVAKEFIKKTSSANKSKFMKAFGKKKKK